MENGAPELKIKSLRLGPTASLGAGTILELGERRTVLVGRNASGKSAVMDAITQGLENISHVGARNDPRRFEARFELGEDDLSYSYDWEPAADDGLTNSMDVRPLEVWSDQFAVNSKLLWRIKNSELAPPLPKTKWRAQMHSPVDLFRTLHVPVGPPAGRDRKIAEYISVLLNSFVSLSRVHAGVPREGERVPVVFQSSEDEGRLTWKAVQASQTRLSRLLGALLDSHERTRELFEELSAIAKRIELFEKMEIAILVRGKKESAARGRYAEILCDGVNAGLLSDGSLRVLETLLALLSTRRTGLVLIEEPETAIHPGLLSALLNEIDSYSIDRHVIVSTHSPQVVNWASPSELRLVTREEGKTAIRNLSDKETQNVKWFLDSQGSLGDFLYSGGIQQ